MGTAPVQLTLAGPGSGKTSTLTGRFVHLIRQGIAPSRILAVTFTRKAADEMRARIAAVLELPSAAGLNIMTFHAFAFRLLRRNPGAAGLPERFQLWDTPEQRRVFTTRRMWWNEEQDILEIIADARVIVHLLFKCLETLEAGYWRRGDTGALYARPPASPTARPCPRHGSGTARLEQPARREGFRR